LLYVGFSTPRKGLEYLAEALKSLPSNVKLVIIGRWETGYRKRFLRALGGAEQRVLEIGYAPDEEMPVYYSLADIFILPSLLEGFGLPLVEAMACGLPVVAAASGSIPEVVGEAGILVPPRDGVALAQAVSKLLKNPTLRRRLRLAGRQNVESRFVRDRMVAETLEFYADYVAN
jgi:glycosyltransferase involved in cell wall biosynthesis